MRCTVTIPAGVRTDNGTVLTKDAIVKLVEQYNSESKPVMSKGEQIGTTIPGTAKQTENGWLEVEMEIEDEELIKLHGCEEEKK